MQAYVPYNSPYKLPIPTSSQPSFTGAVPDVNYPDVSNSALFALAGGTTKNFGLRFTGAGPFTQVAMSLKRGLSSVLGKTCYPPNCVLLDGQNRVVAMYV